ncbi:hypothetical protein MTR67_011756 [Solanum verrucosum]|uniref:Uncharacterized protein n=1 Tax=Solanum verrucosum TaxID=315347 RepID=A0AAF0QD93_SOLVR|nr:hypothetical protein MTR67_011756 [Solanum verrucosum]
MSETIQQIKEQVSNLVCRPAKTSHAHDTNEESDDKEYDFIDCTP